MPALLGSTPKDKALVTMWERRTELDGFAAVMEGVRNATERLKGRAIAGPHNYDQIPALVERSKLRVKDFYADLDARLTEDPFVAGNHFSAADITALVTVDFATKAMSFPCPASISRCITGTKTFQADLVPRLRSRSNHTKQK